MTLSEPFWRISKFGERTINSAHKAITGVTLDNAIEKITEWAETVPGRIRISHLQTLINDDWSDAGVFSDCNTLKEELYDFSKQHVTTGKQINPFLRFYHLLTHELTQLKEKDREGVEKEVRILVQKRTKFIPKAPINPGRIGKAYDGIASIFAAFTGFFQSFQYIPTDSIYIGRMPRELYEAVTAHELSHSAYHKEKGATIIATDVILELAEDYKGMGHRQLAVFWAYLSAAGELQNRTGYNHFQQPINGHEFTISLSPMNPILEYALKDRSREAYILAKKVMRVQKED